MKAAIKKLEELGAKLEEVSLPHTPYALAVYYIIAPSEASANLARYDGVKYGYSYKGEPCGRRMGRPGRTASGRRSSAASCWALMPFPPAIMMPII